MAEIPGDKDALVGEGAKSTGDLETTLDELKNKHSNTLGELDRKGSAIDRIKIEHEAQKIEFVALKAEVVTLTDQLTAAGKEIDALKVECHDLVSLAPPGWPEDKELLNHAVDARDLGQRVEPDGDRFDDGARSQPAESSMGASSSTGMRISSNFVHILMIALVCFGAAFAWQQYYAEGAKALFGGVTLLSFLTAIKSPPDVEVAAKQTGLTPVAQGPAHDAGIPQPDPITPAPPPPAAASIPSNQSEPTIKQQQLPDELQVDEQETKMQTSSPPSQNANTSPEMSPSPLEGWSLREVTAGIAVLEGPTGIWRVTPGDTLPGLGKVGSYIRSNGEWIVPTGNGLITMPIRHNDPTQPLQNDPKLTPTGKPTPKAIEAWSLREVTDGAAVLQGPIGTLRVTIGDTVAGLGKVTAIARWGKGWVVATSTGYCTSARPDHADGICKRYRGN